MPEEKKPQLPKKVDDWKAPWEVNAEGEDIPEDEQEIDRPRLKKYLHGLLSDKARLQGSLTETTARAEELEQKVADATDPKQLETLQAELVKARQERDEARQSAESGQSQENLRLRVALRKGLTERQMKRLVGSTEEELDADADELLSELGSNGERGEDNPNPRMAPKRSFTNSGDPDPEAPLKNVKEKTPDEVAEEYFASR